MKKFYFSKKNKVLESKTKGFYITTAIDYVNAPPHCGHALEKIQADVLARYHRFLGEEVLFLTGTDENSLKNVQAAKKAKLPIKKLVDRNAKQFYELKNILNLSFDDFIRTTETRHIKGAQKLWLACREYIYKKTYRGLYCVECEEFYKESELENGFCPEHKIKPELVEEENYFFKLTRYQAKLKEIIKNDKIKIIPETRKNEVLNFINSGLEDICISRSAKRAQGWGIDAPGDKSQKIWVWFDALSNYINGVGYTDSPREFKRWWPANLHIIGKGILRFHAVYWPAILLAAKLPLPTQIFVHGYLTVGGKKMSKSLGNVVNPFELVKKYGTDAVRYFLLREIPSTEDGDFTIDKFKKRYNSDFAAGLGNLLSRIMTMVSKFKIPAFAKTPAGKQNSKLRKEVENTRKKWREALNNFKFNEVLISIWDLISLCDRYIEKERPWENKNQKVIPDLLFVLSNIAELLQPLLPTTSEIILRQLKTKKGKPLFPRIK